MSPGSTKIRAAHHRPVVILVWDGFGWTDRDEGNAVLHAKMPHFRDLWSRYPHTTLKADGAAVGLPAGQPGNSEVGHATIGAGRIVESDLLRIDRAIDDGSFFKNPAMLEAAEHARKHKSTLNLMGLLTNRASGHASPKHIHALLKFAVQQKSPKIALHLFTDGRDTPPYHAAALISELQKAMPKQARIACIIGRFYAMDRNRFWERTKLAYNLIAEGQGIVADDPLKAVTQAYARGESDEFILPTVIAPSNSKSPHLMDNDAVIYWNLRSDRARQLVKPFVMAEFNARTPEAFHRPRFVRNVPFVTMTEFGSDLDSVIPAYPHHPTEGTLVEALRYHKQLYAAESEKFSQVTYFLNGGYDRPKFGEQRLRVQSPRVARYSQQPAMSSVELTSALLKDMRRGFDFTLVNYANGDMVGHTGDYDAALKACEALDQSLGRIWHWVKARQGTLIITADHGNIEQMRHADTGVDTEHNNDPVPFLIAGPGLGKRHLTPGGLADVAPTILKLLEVKKPAVMTGKSLI